VVNDAEFKIWKQVRPAGLAALHDDQPRRRHPQALPPEEGNYENFSERRRGADQKYDAKINRTELKLGWSAARSSRARSRSPGRSSDPPTSSTSPTLKHHRVLVSDKTGKALEVIGVREREQGRRLREARFDEPQGMALKESFSMSAIAESHDPEDRPGGKTEKTIAGTGVQGLPSAGRRPRSRSRSARRGTWRSNGGRLFIAMAGNHQIWVLSLATG
jgi:hypothetical protein